MKHKKSFLSIIWIALACVLFLWTNLSEEVHAAYHIDVTKPVSINVTYKIGQNRIPDISFSLYRIADISEYGEMKVTKEFERYNINFDELDEESFGRLAENLAAYVKRDKIPAIDQGKTNVEGIFNFPTEESQIFAGIYLVVGGDHVINGQLYDTQPIILHLPSYKGNNQFEYDAKISPKYRLKQRTTEVSVVKIWDDVVKDYRPSQIEVQLIDGKTDMIIDTVVLDKNNGWRHTWTNLPFADWEVIEKEVPENYTVTIERDGDIVILTNTSTEKPPEDPPKDPEDPPEDPPKDPEDPPEDPPKDPEDPPNDPPKDPEDPPNDPDDPEESTESKEPETQEQPTEQKQPVKKLPQTGVCWWPVPILVILGVVCVAAGLIRRRYEE